MNEEAVEAICRRNWSISFPDKPWPGMADPIVQTDAREARADLAAAEPAMRAEFEAEWQEGEPVKSTRIVCPKCGHNLGGVIASLIRQRGKFKARREQEITRADQAEQRLLEVQAERYRLAEGLAEAQRRVRPVIAALIEAFGQYKKALERSKASDPAPEGASQDLWAAESNVDQVLFEAAQLFEALGGERGD